MFLHNLHSYYGFVWIINSLHKIIHIVLLALEKKIIKVFLVKILNQITSYLLFNGLLLNEHSKTATIYSLKYQITLLSPYFVYQIIPRNCSRKRYHSCWKGILSNYSLYKLQSPDNLILRAERVVTYYLKIVTPDRTRTIECIAIMNLCYFIESYVFCFRNLQSEGNSHVGSLICSIVYSMLIEDAKYELCRHDIWWLVHHLTFEKTSSDLLNFLVSPLVKLTVYDAVGFVNKPIKYSAELHVVINKVNRLQCCASLLGSRRLALVFMAFFEYFWFDLFIIKFVMKYSFQDKTYK